ncbi:uncharacterized protein LOC119912090 [Micropterus salmoides]|uniref:uncharacterized protein LOC119912090 n=1 Tax=Micropterus salmoides TaxID=27706 RepID=UPI0018EDB986|nr:uncharacterized protein LOC119912090 [Micropterus salmoides]XP_045920826.1 uncharacterized protein LOC123980461 [Micropterus dolomieu]
MMNFTLVTALLCTFSWISVSVSEFHTVEVQPGEEVTLMCSNFSSFPSNIIWFNLDNRSNASCISSMFSSDANASFCEGFQNSKFNMTSNTTTIFLKIKQVDLSDSGLYFCGFYSYGNSVIINATYLKVQEASDGMTKVTIVVLCAVIIFVVIVAIGLGVKIRNLHTAHKEEWNQQHSENLGSDALNYAALSFRPKAISSRRPESENQMEPNVVYAATR